MERPWEICNHHNNWNDFEKAVTKREQGVWSEENFYKWLKDHCEKCPFFASGEACVYGEIKLNNP